MKQSWDSAVCALLSRVQAKKKYLYSGIDFYGMKLGLDGGDGRRSLSERESSAYVLALEDEIEQALTNLESSIPLFNALRTEMQRCGCWRDSVYFMPVMCFDHNGMIKKRVKKTEAQKMADLEREARDAREIARPVSTSHLDDELL
jgi:hypothetical protein